MRLEQSVEALLLGWFGMGRWPGCVRDYTIQHTALNGTAQLRVHRNWRSCPYLNSIEKIYDMRFVSVSIWQ